MKKKELLSKELEKANEELQTLEQELEKAKKTISVLEQGVQSTHHRVEVVLARFTTDVNLLAKLAESQDVYVRMMVASNEATIPEVLSRLLKDKDIGVQLLAACNKNVIIKNTENIIYDNTGIGNIYEYNYGEYEAYVVMAMIICNKNKVDILESIANDFIKNSPKNSGKFWRSSDIPCWLYQHVELSIKTQELLEDAYGSCIKNSESLSGSNFRILVNKLKKDWRMCQPIESLNFSVKAINCLHHKQICRIFDLVMSTTEEIKSIPNLGRKTFDEISSIMHKSNLKFKDER